MPQEFGFGVPDETTLSIELNTSVTNGFEAMMADDRILAGLTYAGEEGESQPDLGSANDYTGEDREVLSEDGTTISWKLTSGMLMFATEGKTVTIVGIMANASAVGNGEDVTAVVRVNGTVAHSGTLKLADVTTGLDITVTAASGLQCMSDTQTATIKFVEGFASAITDTHQLVLNFRGIPEGVTVTPSMTGMGMPLEDDGADLAPLTLVTGTMSGLNDDNETVALSIAGMGQVVYMFDDGMDADNNADILLGTDPAKAKEWNEVTVTFTWASGDDAPPLGYGSVTVSYHPVSDDDDDNPRYVSGPPTWRLRSQIAPRRCCSRTWSTSPASRPDWSSRILRRKTAPAPSSTAVRMSLPPI